MRPSRFHRCRKGSMTLLLVLVGVLALGVLSLTLSLSVRSFSSSSEMLEQDLAARRLARLALDEALEGIATEAKFKGTWYDALRARRVQGSTFEPIEGTLPLPRTERLRQDCPGVASVTAMATLFQQKPYGVTCGGRTYGGDQTFGTISIRARVDLESSRAGFFGDGRHVEAERLVGFKATLPEPPAPFDQALLWAADPVFLRTQLERMRTHALAVCPALAQRALPRADEVVRGTLYSRLGLEHLGPELFGPEVFTATDCTSLGSAMQSFATTFESAMRFVEDPTTRTNLEQFYWPQLADEAYGHAPLGRADHAFASGAELARFLGSGSGRPVQLNGIYYVAGPQPVTIDFAYQGRGAIVTPGTLCVRRASRVSSPGDHSLTLISTAGDLGLSRAEQTVEASLLAAHGSLRGLTGKRLKGVVAVSRLEDGFEPGSGTTIDFDEAALRHDLTAMAADPGSLQLHFDLAPIAQF